MRQARKCPKCGGKMYVVDSEKASKAGNLNLEHEYRRRRLCCSKCRFRMNTYELEQEDFRRWVRNAKEANLMYARIDGALQSIQKHIRNWQDKLKDDN